MSTAGYARVSSSQNLDLQLEQLADAKLSPAKQQEAPADVATVTLAGEGVVAVEAFQHLPGLAAGLVHGTLWRH